jgi:hypothetical protein
VNRWKQYLRPTWSGIVFGTLVGCIPALLAVSALAIGRVSYQLRAGDRFVAARDSDPIGFWVMTGVLCLAALLVWGKSIIDARTLLCSLRGPHGRRKSRRARETPKA